VTAPGLAGRLPRLPRRLRTRILAGAGLLAVVAGIIVVFANPFGGTGGTAGAFDNAAPTGTATVEERSLSSQTQVSATLGYADPATIVQPAGTSPSALLQAQQSQTTARSQLAGAQATLAADEQSLAQAGAALAADRQKRAADCGGDSAAGAAGANAGPCAGDVQSVATDEQTAAGAAAKVAGDRRAVTSAGAALAAAQTSLATAQSSSAAYGQTSAYTGLPAAGDVVRRNGALYDVDGNPVVLLYGHTTAWRAFAPGVAPGRDVAELKRNLDTLGYGHGLAGNVFDAATETAVKAFQAAHGLAETGALPLGSVVFEPGAVRVTAVTPSLGEAVQPGPVLSATSTKRRVTIALDAASQADVKVGDPVTITLPDNSTTPGHVSYVGTVATAPSADQGGGGGGSPTIEVDVTPSDPAATGSLDQAPVSVSIVTASIQNALVVPVNALLALATGGYALEQIETDGTHRLVPVELGLFDDDQGLVQVTGSAVARGMKIVVPGG
jgi:peptidoglycan hydrolase-like protein with peptidoglycan-binding domain